MTLRRFRRVLLPAAAVVFFGGLLVSARFYFAGKSFTVQDAVISDLQSPLDNPSGYGAAAAATAATGLLLLPAARLFQERLGRVRKKLTWAGTTLFTIGVAAAIAIGALAPFTRDYTPLHIQLAFTAFIGICAGTLAWSIVAKMRALAAFQAGVLFFLVYLFFTPNFFGNQGVLTSLAFWEWMLCADCAVSLWLLASALEE